MCKIMENITALIVCLFIMYNEVVPLMKALLFVKMYYEIFYA